MLVWNVLKRLRFKQLLGLAFLSLKHPLYIYPTLKATTESFYISKKHFSKTHSKNGRGNAYRHALWNAMICLECHKWQQKTDKVLVWAKVITDKHEELFPNKDLDKLMDLHNNRVGRELFMNNDFKSIDEIIAELKSKLMFAKKITTVEETNEFYNELVYITDEG